MAVKSILIIDDDENVRQSLAMILRRSGYCVSLAKNAAMALDIINEVDFNLVFLDIQLPDMDGMDLLALVRKTHPGLCVVVITGTPLSSMTAKIMPLHVLGNFAKPVDPDLILQFLEEALAH